MIKKFEHFDYTNLKCGDIISFNKNKLSFDSIYIYFKSESFYHVNNKFFYNFSNIKNFDKYYLEDFYKVYPELVINTFQEFYKNPPIDSAWDSKIEIIKDAWLKRIPELNIYVQTNKYNL